MEADIQFSKTERQLLLYAIFINAQIVSYNYITYCLPINKRMIQRDIVDLTDAGLLHVTYSRKNRSFIDLGDAAFHEGVTGKRRQHLVRLHRIGTLMRELVNEDVEIWEKEENVQYITCKDSYYSLFPDSNERTRQRDFETLRRIGYPVGYDFESHSFYMWEDSMWDFEVFKKDGVLVRHIDE